MNGNHYTPDPRFERACIVAASNEFMATLLGLPPGAHVDAVWGNPDQPGVVWFRLRGVGPQVSIGMPIPQHQPKVHGHRDEQGNQWFRVTGWPAVDSPATNATPGAPT